MQEQMGQTKDGVPTLDTIEGALAAAVGASALDDCVCKLGNQSKVIAPRVCQVLSNMGCDPVAVAEKIRECVPTMKKFVISEQGFGSSCGSLRLIAMGALAVLEAQAGQ